MSNNKEDLGTTRQTVDMDMRFFLQVKERMAAQRIRKFGAYCISLIEADLGKPATAPMPSPVAPADSILSGLSSEDRAAVVALVEMLTSEVPEDLSDIKGAVIRFLHIWQSRTAKKKAGLRKQHG